MISRHDITAIVLCGGRASRLNNRDKPLLNVAGKKIIERIRDRLAPQVDDILIAGSRNVALYESLNFTVVVDKEPEKGPLAGLCAAFDHVHTEWILTTPGDIPFLSRELVGLLSSKAEELGIVVPVVAGVRQNLCMLLNEKHRTQLQRFYEQGGTAVKHWLDEINASTIAVEDTQSCFFNVNTENELRRAEQLARRLT